MPIAPYILLQDQVLISRRVAEPLRMRIVSRRA